MAWALLGVVWLPVAVYGWVHRLLPVLLVKSAVNRAVRLRPDHTGVSTTVILTGVLSFGAFYGAYVAVVHSIFGLPASFWYALSLPAASLVAHYYLRELKRFSVSMRCTLVRLRAPSAAHRLLALRNELIAEIEAARWQVPAEALTPERKG